MNWKKLLLIVAFLSVKTVSAQVDAQSEIISDATEVVVDEPIYKKVDVLAKYRGGYEVLRQELQEAVKICKRGRYKRKVDSEVIAEVLVDSKGRVTEVYIIRAATDLCKEEIINALKSSKKWIPAQINGKTVSSFVRVSINLQRAHY